MASTRVRRRRRFLVTLASAGTVGLLHGKRAAAAELGAFRIVHQHNVYLHIDLDSVPADTRLFMLRNPDRLVIDFAESKLATQLPGDFPDGPIRRVRHGVQDGRHLRLVLDLRGAMTPTYQYVRRSGGTRLVVDLGVRGNPLLADNSSQIVERMQQPLRSLVVAIDAGHGGQDPGAIGRRKTREKDVTLSIARRLYQRLRAEQGITPVLIRDSDEYVALRDRLRLAREHQADVLISIHADAVPRKAVRGSSVYALSLQGASSETAQWLADNETAADLFGNVTLEGRSKDVQKTLIELAQGSTIEASLLLGDALLQQLGQIGVLHKQQVELADFAVLKSPDIPSVLVETAFISNPKDEKRLVSARYQELVARALHTGIMNYFHLRAPAGTILAAQTGTRSG